MKYYTTLISLLICALLAFSTASAQDQSSKTSTIKLSLYEATNVHWIAVAVQDGEIDTTAVQLLDSAKDASWANMKYVDTLGHWVGGSTIEFVFPISFRITSKDGQQLVIENIVSAPGAQVVDTGVQYSQPKLSDKRKSHTTTPAPESKHHHTTAAPESTTTTTTKAASDKATQVTTAKPKTKATTAAPVTAKPTAAPVTAKPTTTPASSSSSSSAGMKMLVPLYMYPGTQWDTVATGAASIATVAIINPNSGPGNGPDSSYKTYMAKLQAAGVEMVGYVHTSYGARAMSDVQADIAQYASEFPEVTGIFIDECAETADQVPYYTQVHEYIMSMPGYKYNIINPGTVPASGYFAISTQIVSFEDTTSSFATSANPSFATAALKDHFAVIGYSASQSQMTSGVAAAKSKGYYGWVYFTQAGASETYNTLSPYYSAMVSTVVAANM